jgi:hypothetical protein
MNAPQNILTTDPVDLHTAAALADEIDARAALAKSAAYRNHATSAGILVGVTGLTVAACVWAYGQRNPSPEELQAALAKLPPIRVETTLKPGGEVTLKSGGEVSLAEGGEIALKPGGMVGIDPKSTVGVHGDVGIAPGATVRVTGDIRTAPATAGSLPNVPAPAKAGDGTVIRQMVTVFHSVTHGSGEVHSGWDYPSGDATVPVRQYCYWITPDKQGAEQRIALGENGKTSTVGRRLMRDFDQAFGKCVWWKGAA